MHAATAGAIRNMSWARQAYAVLHNTRPTQPRACMLFCTTDDHGRPKAVRGRWNAHAVTYMEWNVFSASQNGSGWILSFIAPVDWSTDTTCRRQVGKATRFCSRSGCILSFLFCSSRLVHRHDLQKYIGGRRPPGSRSGLKGKAPGQHTRPAEGR